MDSSDMIKYMIIFCVAFMLILAMQKPLTYMLKVTINGLFGALGMFIANSLLAGLNLFVGINFLTIFAVGLLGLPGFISLYIINFMLK
ncbi:MAG: pro-sigmaK processing inhibitor BofA family protein [Clostridiales bacterium]|jgi:inhibitor of the pro-sigma K processing machinery|nr:pro-sigmaK processing inhibitor BofA family protein [Clostridiales bacterium]